MEFFLMQTQSIHLNNTNDYKLFSQQADLFKQQNINFSSLNFNHSAEIIEANYDETTSIYYSINNKKSYYKTLYANSINLLVDIQENFIKSENLLINNIINRDLVHKIVQNFKNEYVNLFTSLNIEQEKILFQCSETIADVINSSIIMPTHGAFNANHLFANDNNEISLLLDRPISIGLVAQDISALIKDYHLGWEEEVRIDLAVDYWQKARRSEILADKIHEDFGEFYRIMEFCGVLNHLEQITALSTLSKVSNVEHQIQLESKINLLKHYLHETTKRYNELTPFFALLAKLHDLKIEVGYTF